MHSLYQKSSLEIEFIGKIYPCNLGRNGFIPPENKVEGDGKTPQGSYLITGLYYRQDRLSLPQTTLPVHAIQPKDGWCDAPEHNDYNKLIQKPFVASHEDLWLHDHAYDIFLTIDHNQKPTLPYKGSAIFIHTTKTLENPLLEPTAGCLRVYLDDLLEIIPQLTQESRWIIT